MGPDPGRVLFGQLLKLDGTCPWRCAPGAPSPGRHRHGGGPSQSERFRAGVGLPMVEERLSQDSMDAVSPPPWTAKRGAVNGVFKKGPPPGRWSLWAGCARPRRCGKPSGEPPPPRGFPHLRQDPRAYLLSGLGIFPHPLGQVTRPVVHQDTPAFKQVRAGIGRLENLQGAATQRHPVLAVCLGPPGRDGPHTLVGRRESETRGQGLQALNQGSKGQSGLVSDRIGSEMLVRCLSHKIGYCHRRHRSNSTGKPELVFQSRRKLIVIHVFRISIPQPTAGSPASPKPTGYAGCRSCFARRHTTQST